MCGRAKKEGICNRTAREALTLHQRETSIFRVMARTNSHKADLSSPREPSPGSRTLRVGELSRRTGVPVKTLRFYSDEGLLPPVRRTDKNYRLYTEEQIVRIDLIRTLREAGVSLEEIGKVLRRDMTLESALRLRLRAIEAHVASLQRVAAALRAALRERPPTEEDLRRISMVTRLSNDERRKVIESFYERVAEGMPIDRQWMKQMIDATAPALPDDASAEQLDAWIELAGILEDPTFLESMRANAADFWTKDLNLELFREAKDRVAKAAADARAKGLSPASKEAAAIVDDWATSMARATSGDPNAKSDKSDALAMRERMRLKADPRAERYWELVTIMKGKKGLEGDFGDMKWLNAAIRHHVMNVIT
jgi:DNA-binding transcriptional MerR regulator